MEQKKSFESEMKGLLSQRASEEETANLREMGFAYKKPTRMTVLAAVVYKKAAGGDMSSIKEILSAVGGNTEDSGGVIFLDDIKNTAE